MSAAGNATPAAGRRRAAGARLGAALPEPGDSDSDNDGDSAGAGHRPPGQAEAAAVPAPRAQPLAPRAPPGCASGPVNY